MKLNMFLELMCSTRKLKMTKIACHILNVIKGNTARLDLTTEVYLSIALTTKKIFRKPEHNIYQVFGEFKRAGELNWYYVESGRKVETNTAQAINKSYISLMEHDKNLNRVVKFSKDLKL